LRIIEQIVEEFREKCFVFRVIEGFEFDPNRNDYEIKELEKFIQQWKQELVEGLGSQSVGLGRQQIGVAPHAQRRQPTSHLKLLPTLQDFISSYSYENSPTIPTPNTLNSFVEELRNRGQQNLIQEWERVYTREGRARLKDK
jgi:hypothetical protein